MNRLIDLKVEDITYEHFGPEVARCFSERRVINHLSDLKVEDITYEHFGPEVARCFKQIPRKCMDWISNFTHADIGAEVEMAFNGKKLKQPSRIDRKKLKRFKAILSGECAEYAVARRGSFLALRRLKKRHI